LRYLSKKHAAEMLDVSLRTLDRYISRRFITARMLRSGSVRIAVDEVEKCFKADFFDSVHGNNPISNISNNK